MNASAGKGAVQGSHRMGAVRRTWSLGTPFLRCIQSVSMRMLSVQRFAASTPIVGSACTAAHTAGSLPARAFSSSLSSACRALAAAYFSAASAWSSPAGREARAAAAASSSFATCVLTAASSAVTASCCTRALLARVDFRDQKYTLVPTAQAAGASVVDGTYGAVAPGSCSFEAPRVGLWDWARTLVLRRQVVVHQRHDHI